MTFVTTMRVDYAEVCDNKHELQFIKRRSSLDSQLETEKDVLSKSKYLSEFWRGGAQYLSISVENIEVITLL